MKVARIGLVVLGLAFILFVIAPVASAQNTPGFAVWDGTLLKLKSTIKGYYYSPTTRNNLNSYDQKVSEGETQWGIVTGDITGTFQISIFSKDPNTKACVPQMILPLNYLAGSQTEFVANYLVSDMDIYSTGLVYVKAKLDTGGTSIKQGGTITSMAAYTIEYGFDVPLDLVASGLTIKGSVVKELGCTLAP
jgi:hypothetical protein